MNLAVELLCVTSGHWNHSRTLSLLAEFGGFDRFRSHETYVAGVPAKYAPRSVSDSRASLR
jgi:hypothetical protein